MVLTQTHPAASYVCRTGNITLRCQYDGVENVLNVLWNVDDMPNLDFDSMTLPGHTALDRTESHQDLVIASFANLRGTYQCSVIQSTDITNSPQLSPGPVEGAFDTVIVLYHLADIAQLRIHTIAIYPQYAILTVSFQMKALFSLHWPWQTGQPPL